MKRDKDPSIKSSYLEIKIELASLDIPSIAHVFVDGSHVENLKIRLVIEETYFMGYNMWLKSGLKLVGKSVFGCDSETKDMSKVLFTMIFFKTFGYHFYFSYIFCRIYLIHLKKN